MLINKTIFITATDTHVGKTVATFVLAALLRSKGLRVGIIKPVQCGGHDAQFLDAVNPFYAPEPLSPHLALARAKIKFDKRRVIADLKQLQKTNDIVLIEGAGGLMVPITHQYFNADLIRDLKADVIIVSRLGLGTINHTLLTVNQAKACGLSIKGILFSDTNPKPKTLPERTNPLEIQKLSGITVLGIIPYLKQLTQANILKQCQKIKLPV